MGKAQLEQLERHGMYLSVPRGTSMLPMLRSKRDVVEIHRLERPAKRCDLVLYVRGEEQQGVLHRVIAVREKDYVIAGDNCWWREVVPHGQVVGIAVRFYRGGRWHEVTDAGYRLYARVWTDLFYVRRPFLWLRDKARARLGRLWNKMRKQA